MNAPTNVVHLHDEADSVLREDAIDNLKWRLRDGKQVGGFTFAALLDSELDGDRRHVLLEELDTLINGEGGSDTRDGFANRLREGIIERFLLSHPELVEQEMARFERATEAT